ncbi:hypothetical protein GGI07_000990 [Coemansia sp. Benny D115]|nr:hypothetical protein GGI07_000990 [Coemansia sp. Benny D115]
MSSNRQTPNGTGNTAEVLTNGLRDASASELLAQLRERLEKLDKMDLEIVKLNQEQTMLENYVANMMASNVDDDESEFELSDEEFVKPKKKKVKTNPPAKTTKSSGDVSKKPSVSKRAVSPAQNSKPDRLEKEDTLVIDPLSDDQEEPKMFANKSADHAPNSNMNKLESGSQSKDYSQSENKNHSDSDSDLTSIADSPSSRVGTVDTEIAPRDSSSKDSDFSDNNALSDAGDYSDDGSDYKYGDEECVVVINNAKTKKTQSSKASSSKSNQDESQSQRWLKVSNFKRITQECYKASSGIYVQGI